MGDYGRVIFLSILIGVLGWGGSVRAAAPYQIRWYFIGNGPQRDVKLVEQAISRYIQKKGLNATVKLQCFAWGDEYNRRMWKMISCREPFDICFTASWANMYKVNVAMGSFLDLTDLLGKYTPKTKQQLHPAFLKGSAINGRNYGIPTNKELAHVWSVSFNRRLVEKYRFNLSTIKALADLEPLLKVIKAKEPQVIPFQNLKDDNAIRVLNFDRIVDDAIPASLYTDSSNTKVFNLLATKEFQEYIQLMRKYYIAGYIPAYSPTESDAISDMKAGRVFCRIESGKPFHAEERSASWGLPIVDVNLTKPTIQTSDCTGSMQAISGTSQNPALALKFLELVNTDKVLNNLINFGIEGRHFVKVSANVIDFPKGITARNSGYQPGTPWLFGNQYLNYFWQGENTGKWNAYQKFNNSATPAKSLGFNFNPQSVENETKICRDLWYTYVAPLICGASDPKELPGIIARFKAAGLDKIIAETQKQLDAWVAQQKQK